MDNTHLFWQRKIQNLLVLAVLILIINLPIVSALEISNVHVEDVSDTGARVVWDTNETANSFVSYGTNKSDLNTIGDANPVSGHSLTLTGLGNSTTYYYEVQSEEVTDNNSGEYYSFSTLAPDTTPPELVADVPPLAKGERIDVEGWTEVGAVVRLFVNGELFGSAVATSAATNNAIDNATVNTTEASNALGNTGHPEGHFIFSSVLLARNIENNLTLESADQAGNVARREFLVFADTSRPAIRLENLSAVTTSTSLDINASISENSTYEIFVNNRSVAQGEGTAIKQTISLAEGRNALKIIARDAAGWETIEERNILVDSQPPTVTFQISHGNEYYQGRAHSDISGRTKPGANVYLYVYRPIGYEYNPQFDKAWAKVTADESGNFTFSDVNFEMEPFSLTALAPRQVPSELQRYSIFPIEQLAEQQRWTYHIFVIVEDAMGRSASAPPSVITVNTCYSGALNFDVQSLAQFQAPLRLHPDLLDQGREVITAVFNISYRGSGTAGRDWATGRDIPGREPFVINSVDFEKACTPGMLQDPSYKIACNVFPSAPRGRTPNADQSAWLLTYNLHSSRTLSETQESFWNEFTRRQLVFPLKVKVNYQERDSNGNLGPVKTQVSCQDLSYFVDIPIDSKNMIPDFLADEGVRGLNATIRAIDTVMPYLETAIKVAGIACVGSFLTKMVIRYVRIAVSKLEVFSSAGKCPLNQNGFLLRSTINTWKEKSVTDWGPYSEYKTNGKKPLDEVCPNTASLWNYETVIDQAYRWTCDRVLCRTVPAGWTEDKREDQVKSVILAQSQCAASSKGVPLRLIENCDKIPELKNVNPNTMSGHARNLSARGSFKCYYNPLNGQYYDVLAKKPTENTVELKWLAPSLTLEQAFQVSREDLFAYQSPNSKEILVGTGETCKTTCEGPPSRLTGYKAAGASENALVNYRMEEGKLKQGTYGCYKEVLDENGQITFEGKAGGNLKEGSYAAGYTTDCFLNLNAQGQPQRIGKNETGLLRCICVPDKEKLATTTTTYGARLAKENEPWIYRQADIYRDTKVMGTDYPKWRYYSGRDFSGAFGQDYLTDVFRDDNEKVYHEINPNTQIIGTFQSVCLPGIWARLRTLRSILQAAQNCLIEAKYKGLQDAGVCKSLFSRQVCGLIYQGIAYLSKGCSPNSLQDSQKGKSGTIESIKQVSSAVFGSVDEAMKSSIDEVTSDYTNAKLESFFSTGARGFSESICLAAFGYDWPMGMQFINDVAYAFPTSTSVVVVPAERELSTYNPAKATAIYNYNIGALVIPGCKIRNAEVYLKCVGKEDENRPDVQCTSESCACLNQDPSTADQRRYNLDFQNRLSFKPGNTVDLKITTPQKVDSFYRYDHVVIHLNLDRFENPETCFDEGNRDGTFYFPITDTSAPGEFVCQANFMSGRYTCPQVMQMFGGGAGAYFEEPFLSCYDKRTLSWVDCNTPNLFVKGDEIKVRGHITTDGGKYCLKTNIRQLYANTPDFPSPPTLLAPISGTQLPALNLGTVSEALFTGGGSTFTLVSGAGCLQPQPLQSAAAQTTISPGQYIFTFIPDGMGYKVPLPQGVIVNPPYGNIGGFVTYGGSATLTAEQARGAVYNVNGLLVQNIFGAGTSGQIQCTYQVGASVGSTAQAMNQKSFSVSMELLQPDASGDCFDAYLPLRAPVFGRNKIDKSIAIQLEPISSQVISRVHQELKNNNWNYVRQYASGIINQRRANIDDATAIYYMVASYILEKRDDWNTAYNREVCGYLDMFFNRKYATGEQAVQYSDNDKNSVEYKKIEKYLGEVRNGITCQGITWASNSLSSGGACDVNTYNVAIAGDPWRYKCLGGGRADGCKMSDGTLNPNFAIPPDNVLNQLCVAAGFT